jgi:hypothetical protein
MEEEEEEAQEEVVVVVVVVVIRWRTDLYLRSSRLDSVLNQGGGWIEE